MAHFEHGQEIFLPKNIQASTMACPDSYSVGTRGSSAVDNWPGGEADHTPTSYAKVQ